MERPNDIRLASILRFFLPDSELVCWVLKFDSSSFFTYFYKIGEFINAAPNVCSPSDSSIYNPIMEEVREEEQVGIIFWSGFAIPNVCSLYSSEDFLIEEEDRTPRDWIFLLLLIV